MQEKHLKGKQFFSLNTHDDEGEGEEADVQENSIHTHTHACMKNNFWTDVPFAYPEKKLIRNLFQEFVFLALFLSEFSCM